MGRLPPTPAQEKGSRMAQEWNIRPRAHQCHDCAKAFEDGERCFSTLFLELQLDGAQELVRHDRCQACRANTPDVPSASAWQGIYRAPEPPSPEVAPRQTVERLLRDLMESGDNEADIPVMYVLAVMLERRKLLIERDCRPRPDGTTLRVYEDRKTGEVLLVTDPGLRLDQLGPVQERVAYLLSTPPSDNAASSGEEASSAAASPEAESSGDSAPK